MFQDESNINLKRNIREEVLMNILNICLVMSNIILQNCKQTNGTELVCETPDLRNVSILYSRLQVIVRLENDDFYWNLWTNDQPFYLTVHKDPEIQGLTNILHNTRHLELKVIEKKIVHICTCI
jgi:hypothetical protein